MEKLNDIYLDLFGYRFYGMFFFIIFVVLILIGVTLYLIKENRELEDVPQPKSERKEKKFSFKKKSNETIIEEDMDAISEEELEDELTNDVLDEDTEEINPEETVEDLSEEVKEKVQEEKPSWQNKINRIFKWQAHQLPRVIENELSEVFEDADMESDEVKQSDLYQVLSNGISVIETNKHWNPQDFLKVNPSSVMFINEILVDQMAMYWEAHLADPDNDSDGYLQIVSHFSHALDSLNGGTMDITKTLWVKSKGKASAIDGYTAHQTNMAFLLAEVSETIKEFYKRPDFDEIKEDALSSNLLETDIQEIDRLLSYLFNGESLSDIYADDSDILISIGLFYIDASIRQYRVDNEVKVLPDYELSILRSICMLIESVDYPEVLNMYYKENIPPKG